MTARILAIDVSGPGGGAALLTPTGVATALLPPDVRRGRDLVPLLRELLAAGGLAPTDLDLVACGVGPGSFTGIRVGVATAATFAYAAGLPVLDVGSLHGLAAHAPPASRTVLVALDARRGRLFSARFDEGRLVGRYENARPEEAVRGLPPDAYVVGDGRARYPEVLGAFAGLDNAPVRPDVIARIAAERFARGERRAPAELRPLYLRLSDPELRRPAPDSGGAAREAR